MESPAHATRQNPQLDHPALAERVAAACLLRGTFTLRSGRTSTYYLDKYQFSTRPELLGPVAHLMGQRALRLFDNAPDRTSDRAADKASSQPAPPAAQRLAGAELGGVPLVAACSLAVGLPGLYVRSAAKGYGTAKRLEGTLEAGDAVVLLEDVATTGGQALEAAAVLREAGARVLGVVAAIDRLEGAAENVRNAGLDFQAIFTRADLGVTD